MTWFANALVLIGLVLVGSSRARIRRAAFLFTLVGEAIWCSSGFAKGMFDLGFICFVFACAAAVNYCRLAWQPQEGAK